MNKKILIGAIIGCIGIVALFCIPTTYHSIVREGTDTFESHHALWGPRKKDVTFTAKAPVTGVGLVLVNLRRAPSLPPVIVRVLVDGQQVDQKAVSVSSTADDNFSWVYFSKSPVRVGQEGTVEVSAPDATSANAIGVRFDKESGQLALGVSEQVPAWRQGLLWAQAKPELARRVLTTIMGGAGLAAALFLLEFFSHPLSLPLGQGEKSRPLSLRRRGWVRLWALGCLFAFAIAIRIPLANSIESAYGGDAFNYLLKSRAWIDGRDPFAADPRKAPLYPLLAVPGLLPFLDAVTVERAINIVAAAGTAVLVVLFLRRLTIPFSLALGGGMLVAVNRDIQFESVQGLSNPTYMFLVLLTAYMFFIGKTYLVAVAGSLAALVRYEGGIIPLLLVPLSWVVERARKWNVVRSSIPIIVLFAIPLLLSPFSGSSGVRTLSDIRGDEGLYLAHSVDDFLSNFKGFHQFFGRLWILTPDIGHPFRWFCIGSLASLAWLGRRSPLPILGEGGSRSSGMGEGRSIASWPALIPAFAKATAGKRAYNSQLALSAEACCAGGGEGILVLLTLTFLFFLIRDATEQMHYIVGMFSLIAGIGVAAAVFAAPKRTIPVLLMIAIQIVVITVILPKSRYYLPIVPFTAMAIVGGVHAISNGKRKTTSIASIVFVGMLCAFVYADAKQALPGQVSDYNEKSAGQTVLLNAVRFVKNQTGTVAVAQGSDLQAMAYLSFERVKVFPDFQRDTAIQLQMLEEGRVRYVIDTSENPYFTKLIEEYPARFAPVHATVWEVLY